MSDNNGRIDGILSSSSRRSKTNRRYRLKRRMIEEAKKKSSGNTFNSAEENLQVDNSSDSSIGETLETVPIVPAVLIEAPGREISHPQRNKGHAVEQEMKENDYRDEGMDEDSVCTADNKEEMQGTSKSVFSIERLSNANVTIQLRPHVTNETIISAILAWSMRNRATYESTSGIFELLGRLTMPNVLPRSMKGVWRTLMRNDDATFVRRYYCQKCQTVVCTDENGSRKCECAAVPGTQLMDSQFKYFVELGITNQIETLLATPGIADSLMYRFTRTKRNIDAMEDVYDGFEYKRHAAPGEFLSNPYNYSFVFNTDGCSVSASSHASAWPVYVMLNELPPHLRKRHMILAAIWVDTRHPPLNTFLRSTMTELRRLHEQGVTWRPNGVDEVTSKFATLICTVDSIARPSLLNMSQFNGEYGCTFCYARGYSKPGKGGSRVYPVKTEILERSDRKMRRQMQLAFEQKKKVYGVKGPSILMTLPKFDLAKGSVVDSMHNLFLGVTKQHTMLLMLGKSRGNVWYRGQVRNVARVNQRLCKIRPHGRISRRPRPVQTMKNWKASEWRNWILYYALPCLDGVVRNCDLEHLALLSRAAYILNGDSISNEELRNTKKLLDEYVQRFQETFGEERMTYNVHLLNHLTNYVLYWGPLWTHSAFPFESYNRKIIESVTSSNSPCLQIATRFSTLKFLENVMHDTATSYETRDIVRKCLYRNRKCPPTEEERTHMAEASFKALDNGYQACPEQWQIDALTAGCYNVPEILTCFNKAMLNGTEFRCKRSKNKTKFCNAHVCVENNGLGAILNIVQFNDGQREMHGLFVKVFSHEGNAFGAEHIINVKEEGKIVFVESKMIEGPAMTIETDKIFCAMKLSNVWETD